MSKIEELIRELCPDGVELKKISEVAEVGTGSKNGNEAIENGEYPLFVRSKIVKKIDSFEFDEEAIIIPGEGGIGEIFHHINGKYSLHQRAYRIHFLAEGILTRFVYFYMMVKFKEFIFQKAVNATVSSIRKPMIEKFQIPVPPLPIQREIVSILDKFTQLEAELEAELEARSAQYKYYRDQLLSFEDNDVEWKTLGEISRHVSSGGTPLSTKTEYYNGDIPWLRTQEVRFNEIFETENFITEQGLKESSAKWIPENCVIIAISGATAGRSAINKIALTTNQHCCNLEIDPKKALYRYVFHWVSCKYLQLKAMGQGARSDLNAGMIKSFLIPIPPLSEQERIVAILDKFDALVNDISAGLPAEIAARRKQYEYYRAKLLNFNRLNQDLQD